MEPLTMTEDEFMMGISLARGSINESDVIMNNNISNISSQVKALINTGYDINYIRTVSLIRDYYKKLINVELIN